jgi:hypothetical protein
MAIDLKNEPHDPATWGNDVLGTDWNSAAERIINYIAGKNPNFGGLFFVEGSFGRTHTHTYKY